MIISKDLEKKIKESHLEYDEDYFEKGIATEKSGYDNYRWLPEMTIKFAHKIIKNLELREGDKILDFGCAKGFLVKAFRILDINAYGCDVSKYGIKNVDKEVEKYCKLSEGKIPFNENFHWVISKDVFEHLYKKEVESILDDIRRVSKNLFAVIPLGENGKYVVPSYDRDVTHKIAETREWWEQKFEKSGWKVDRFSYLIRGMKDNWASYEKGNGFFFLSKKE